MVQRSAVDLRPRFIPKRSCGRAVWLLQNTTMKTHSAMPQRKLHSPPAWDSNSVRFFVPFYLWRVQHDTFMKNLRAAACSARPYHMTMMPTLFNDCCVANPNTQIRFSVWPEPVPGYFGGTAVAPFDSDTKRRYRQLRHHR